MIVVPNSVTSSVNKEGFETMAQIITVISNTNGKKEKNIRHSLKNLCFYPPESTALNPLIDLLLHELDLKETTKSFKLICMNLIAHAPLANTSASVPSLLQKISQRLLDLSKPANYHRQAFLLYRVLFNLSLYLPQNVSILISTVSELFQIDLNTLSKLKKKSIIGSKEVKTPLPDLVHEVFSLLPDLLTIENAVEQIFSDQKVVDGFLAQYQFVSDKDKISAIYLIGQMKSPPEQFLNIDLTNTELLTRINCLEYIAASKDKYTEFINDLLSKTQSSSLRYIQLLLATRHGLSPELLASITKNINTGDIKHSQILPLFIYLTQSPRITMDENVTHQLFKICEKNESTLGFLSFMCITYVSDEIDWMKGFLHQFLLKQNKEVRQSLIRIAIRSWATAIEYDEHIDVIRPLFVETVESFGESLDYTFVEGFLGRIISKGHTDDFVENAQKVIERIPMIETVIYLLLCIRTIKDKVTTEVLASFYETTKNYVINSGPALNTIFEAVFPPVNA